MLARSPGDGYTCPWENLAQKPHRLVFKTALTTELVQCAPQLHLVAWPDAQNLMGVPHVQRHAHHLTFSQADAKGCGLQANCCQTARRADL